MRGRDVVRWIPPPLLYVASFALGLIIERVAPSPLGRTLAESPSLAMARRIVAGLCIAVGAVLGPLNAIRFLFRRTTLNPNAQATLFLREGIYRLSRNPMYLGLFLIYVGVAILQAKLWPFATMVLPFVALDRIVIPFEEQQMTARFGTAHADYCSHVRKWIGSRARSDRS